MRLQDALDSYLLQLAADGRSAHTLSQYGRHLRSFAAWVGPDRDLDVITTTDVAKYMTTPAVIEGRSPVTLNAVRTSLRVFFAFAHSAGFVAHNPGRLLRRSLCSAGPPRGLLEDEITRLMDSLTVAQGPVARRDHLLIAVMLRAGLRLGSALALNRGDVDLGRGELLMRVAKNQQVERVYLSRELRDHLVGYLAGRGERADEPLFTGPGGARLGQRQAQRRVEIWLRRAGIEHGSAHSLRHSFALSLYARCGDVLLVKEAMRHRSIASTLIYARPREAELKRVLQA